MVLSRRQVAEHLGVTVQTIRTWERAGAAAPSTPSVFQTWDPARYDPADVALLQVIAHASALGMQGSQLSELWSSLQPLRRFLTAGWRGVIVTDTGGAAWMIGPGVPGPHTLDEVLATLPPGSQLRTVTRVEIPT